MLDPLDRIERRLSQLEADQATRQQVADVSARLDERTDWLWASKALNVGDRVLVGCRHLGLNLYFPADDRLLMPQFVVHGEYEPLTTAFLVDALEPESVCIDVGANVGYYTCLMARRAWRGRTIAFEADPVTHAILVDNVGINWCEKVVDARNTAVADQAGTLTLYRRVGRGGNTSIIEVAEEERSQLGEPASVPFEVECLTLDEVTAPLSRLDVVKIDVEGAESLVLQGMAETVARLDPMIIMEWSPGQAESAGSGTRLLRELIEELGLAAFRIDGARALHRLGFAELEELPYQNVLLRTP